MKKFFKYSLTLIFSIFLLALILDYFNCIHHFFDSLSHFIVHFWFIIAVISLILSVLYRGKMRLILKALPLFAVVNYFYLILQGAPIKFAYNHNYIWL